MTEHTGFFLTGELRLVSERNGYLNIYILPADATSAIDVSISAKSELAEQFKALQRGSTVRVRLTKPFVGTSKAGKPYLAGMRPLSVDVVEF